MVYPFLKPPWIYIISKSPVITTTKATIILAGEIANTRTSQANSRLLTWAWPGWSQGWEAQHAEAMLWTSTELRMSSTDACLLKVAMLPASIYTVSVWGHALEGALLRMREFARQLWNLSWKHARYSHRRPQSERSYSNSKSLKANRPRNTKGEITDCGPVRSSNCSTEGESGRKIPT